MRVGHHDGRLAAILAGLLLVADLRLNACKAGQASNAVLRYGLAHVAEIIMDLAVSIDFAAVLPSLLHQPGLTLILQRTLA